MDEGTRFRAMVVDQIGGRFERRIVDRKISSLPEGDVLINVSYSSLNYKDALSASGNKGITRDYPHTPGIDAAGTVANSKTSRFSPGQPVLVTGYDLGMNTPGGFGQYVRVPKHWVLPLPRGLSLQEAMMFGTAGLTAAMGVLKLQHAGINPGSGPVLVTGASGGVGSLAVAIMSHLGYEIVAVSGKAEAVAWLTALGACQVIPRNELDTESTKPLLPKRWIGALDTVGGPVLAAVLRSIDRHGAVACCGNVASARLELTVYPFILRGISLLGLDSATSPMEFRRTAWHLLADKWKPPQLQSLVKKINLDQLDRAIDIMLAGSHMGRFLVDLKA